MSFTNPFNYLTGHSKPFNPPMDHSGQNALQLPRLYDVEVGKTLDRLSDSFKTYASDIRNPKEVESRSYSSSYSHYAPTYINSYNTSNSSKSDDKDNVAGRVLAGIVFTVIGLAGAYFLGKAMGGKTEAKINKVDLKVLRQYLNDTANEANENSRAGIRLENGRTLEIHMQKIDAAIKEGEEVTTEKKSNSKRNITVAVGFVAAAALGVLGAVFNAPVLMVVSALSIVVLTGIVLFNMGSGNATEHLTASKADRVARILKNLRDEINKYQDLNRTDLPRPGYYHVMNVNYMQPAQPNLSHSGPGSYGLNFIVQPQDIENVLTSSMPSAPPIDD